MIPEPLELAHALELQDLHTTTLDFETAAELRRLQAQIVLLESSKQRLIDQINKNNPLIDEAATHIDKLEAANADLLEALKRVHMNCAQPSLWLSAVNDALKKHGGGAT